VHQSRAIMVAHADHCLLENSIASVWKAMRVRRVTVTSMNVRLVMTSVSMEAPVSTLTAATGLYHDWKAFSVYLQYVSK